MIGIREMDDVFEIWLLIIGSALLVGTIGEFWSWVLVSTILFLFIILPWCIRYYKELRRPPTGVWINEKNEWEFKEK
jgi:hypothetical protein